MNAIVVIVAVLLIVVIIAVLLIVVIVAVLLIVVIVAISNMLPRAPRLKTVVPQVPPGHPGVSKDGQCISLSLSIYIYIYI